MELRTCQPSSVCPSCGAASSRVHSRYTRKLLQAAIVKKTLGEAGLLTSDAALPASVRVKHGLGNDGRMLHYYLNYAGEPATFLYQYKAGTDLLTGKPVGGGNQVRVEGWGVAIVEEAP